MAERPPRPAGARCRHASPIAVLVTVALAALLVAGVVGAPAATGRPRHQTAPPGTSPAPAAPPTPPATEPQPTGQALPSRTQRLGDSLIAAWILLVLVGGVVVAVVWSRRSIAQR